MKDGSTPAPLSSRRRIAAAPRTVVAALILLAASATTLSAQTTPAPLARTGCSTVFAPGDDGSWLAGVEWPVPRFTDNLDGTVTDNLTGLIWLQHAHCWGGQTWDESMLTANTLKSGDGCPLHPEFTLQDSSLPGEWRLPSMVELMTLIHWGEFDPAIPDTLGTGKWNVNGDPFFGLDSIQLPCTDPPCGVYWSSTSSAIVGHAWKWYVILTHGYMNRVQKDLNPYLAWPVRGGQVSCDDAAPARRSGQAIPFVENDDGHRQYGVTWPNPRFTDNGDGTVTDEVTGLIWLRHANCFAPLSWADSLAVANTLASGASCPNDPTFVLSDGSIAGEWRLPNLNELGSLVHWGNNKPAVPDQVGTRPWVEGNIFSNVLNAYYWSASSFAASTNDAWRILMLSGFTFKASKTAASSVWPVRDP